jgi:hypothetical protein
VFSVHAAWPGRPDLAVLLGVLDVIPPVIHVVTSGGIDWAAIVAPLAAAAAGAVGVYATVRQARHDRRVQSADLERSRDAQSADLERSRDAQSADLERSRDAQSADLKRSIDAAAENLRLSISAEDGRAKLAEKRRIYAHCLATLNVLMVVTIKTELSRDEPAAIRGPAVEERTAAILAATSAVFEVKLLGEAKVSNLAGDALRRIMSLKLGAETEAYGDVLVPLIFAMRTDLGEPGAPVAQAASPGQPADPAPGDC